MVNWFCDVAEALNKSINAIMSELEYLTVNPTENHTANYWLDSKHNIFAFVNDNGDGDAWIEIHYELYDDKEDIIGDLYVTNTIDTSRESLLGEIKGIVLMYHRM